MNTTRRFAVAWAGQLLVCGIIYALVPSSRLLFREEDQPIEVLSAALLFVAAILCFWLLARRARSTKLLLLTLGLSLVGFLDEVSFGARLFDLDMPSLNGKTIDGFHDFVGVFLDLARESRNTVVMISVLVIAAGGVGAFAYRKRLITLFQTVRSQPPFWALSAFVLLIGAATLIDAHLIEFRGHMFVEEILELNSAFFLVLVPLLIRREHRLVGSDHSPLKTRMT